jgi:hypothetical protein
MLLAQTSTPPRFRDECAQCHGNAADFLRDAMDFKDGKLTVRRSGSPVQQFLQSHRDLAQDDILFYLGLFTRLAKEIYRP